MAAQELAAGRIIEITFPAAGISPTLYTLVTGTAATPCLTVRLPDDYDASKTYPLLVYVPGFHGGMKGNIGNAQTIAGPREWVVASLTLFKKSIDRDEPAGGLLVSFEDYSTISKAYQIMLGRLFERVPNIDREKSAMVGFSNGALTIAVLVSCHDEFILTHFGNFCLVDHGMFHLTDLHKKWTRNRRFLVLVGDKKDLGRDLKVKGSQLLQEEMQLVGVDLTCRIMKDTGHEFQGKQMELVGKWLRKESLDGLSIAPEQDKPPR
jgi:predicted esterase